METYVIEMDEIRSYDNIVVDCTSTHAAVRMGHPDALLFARATLSLTFIINEGRRILDS